MQAALYKSPALQSLTGPVLRPGGLELTRESAKLCGLKPRQKILDVGCGQGQGAAMLSNEFKAEAYGLDLDFQLLQAGANIPVVQARAENLPFADNHFDFVFCECVLSLTPDMGQTLQEFQRILRVGGKLVLCDIHLRNPQFDHNLQQIPLACGFRQAVHKDKIQKLVQAAGLEMQWQDISPVLTQLAARAIFEHGSLQNFWNEVFGSGNLNTACASKTCENIRASRPGYFRIIAQKRGT